VSESQRRPKQQPRARGTEVGRALDAMARETVDLFTTVMFECGFSTSQTLARVEKRCDSASPTAIRHAAASSKNLDLAAHPFTYWSRDSACLDSEGRMRPIRALGEPPSIEALLKKAKLKLDPTTAIGHLLSTGLLCFSGNVYVPREEWVYHPAGSASLSSHHLRALLSYLRNFRNNRSVRSRNEPWFERTADHVAIPRSQIPRLLKYMKRQGLPFLKDKDAVMYRMSRRRKRGEPVYPVDIAAFLSIGGGYSVSSRARTRQAK